MTELPLFDNPHPEPEGDYKVPTLRAHGDEHRGPWLTFWAEAKHPLYSYQDRAAVMRARGFDPEAWTLYPAAPINALPDGFKRTWWLTWPKGKPSITEI